MEENKLERAVGQFVSAHQLEIGSTELAPTFLVVTLLLTHFALGYLQVMPGVSYADAMCLGGRYGNRNHASAQQPPARERPVASSRICAFRYSMRHLPSIQSPKRSLARSRAICVVNLCRRICSPCKRLLV